MVSWARLKFRDDTEDNDVAGERELLLRFSVENEPMEHSDRAEVKVLAGDGRCGNNFFDVAIAARMPRRPAMVDGQGSTMTRNINCFEVEGREGRDHTIPPPKNVGRAIYEYVC
jgi:hypothetical protein